MYIIFAGNQYIKGGANDIVGYYKTYDLTLQKYKEFVNIYDWVQILDIETKEIILYYKKTNNIKF